MVQIDRIILTTAAPRSAQVRKGAIVILEDDPRINKRHYRIVTHPEYCPLTLVGVVHDHPASIHRVQSIVASINPGILALELPPLAISLFTHYADSDPIRYGGEMSAAIQTASTDRIVGIDGPSIRFVPHALRAVRSTPTNWATLGVVRSIGSAMVDALWCSLAASIPPLRNRVASNHRSTRFSAIATKNAAEQAQDEHEHLNRARAILDAFEPKDITRIREVARERHMTTELDQLRKENDVVAVVGQYHLDHLAEYLQRSESL